VDASASGGSAAGVSTASSVASADAAITDGALARAPQTVDVSIRGSELNLDGLRSSVEQALQAAGHQSAAAFINGSRWQLDGSNLRIEVSAGKKMIGLTFSAAAEKIIRQTLQGGGLAVRFMILPGEGLSSSASTSAPLAPRGNVEKSALEHPLVQRALDLFHADVRSVLDLSQK
jgi:DNA polymerase-3 subunit gamma/tau